MVYVKSDSNQDHLDFLILPRSFIVLCFIFESVVHFELVFVRDSMSLHVDVWLFPHHLFRRPSFSIGLSFLLFQRSDEFIMRGFFCASRFYDSTCILSPHHTVLITVVYSKSCSQYYQSSDFVL